MSLRARGNKKAPRAKGRPVPAPDAPPTPAAAPAPSNAPAPAPPALAVAASASTAAASCPKPADQPVKLKGVWDKGHAERVTVEGKKGWKCPWCSKIFFPEHATRALWHWMKSKSPPHLQKNTRNTFYKERRRTSAKR